MLDFVTLSVDSAAGGGGSTTDGVTRFGQILAVALDYHADANAGTDVTITCEAGPGPVLTVLTVSNAKTDGWFYPRGGAVSTANVAITDSHVPLPFYGNLKATVADAGGALTGAVKATICYDDGR